MCQNYSKRGVFGYHLGVGEGTDIENHMKIVKVIWVDAAGLTKEDQQWFSLEGAKARAEEVYSILSETVGQIIIENKKYIIIAATKAGDQYSDMSLIPCGMIIKRVKLN